MERVYLDYAATTPVDERVFTAMQPYFCTEFGNASSLYSYGRTARQAVARARRQVAMLIGADPREIFFTSGGSESDNWALKGLAWAQRRAGRGRHIITSVIEHHAVLNACAWLEREGFEITYLPVDARGRVSVAAVEAAIRSDTVLVSIMTANNEIGTIEPIAEIGARLRVLEIPFHTDAVQAVGHIPVAVDELKVDALSLSGHKIYAPKGVGALYLRRGCAIEPLIHGGAQERELRAGTENVPGIVALGMAAEIARKELGAEWERLSALRDRLLTEIGSLPSAHINGDTNYRLPHNVSFGIAGVAQDTLLIRLDMAGFAVSAGSACSAGSLEPSHVLTAIGQSREQVATAVRVTLGRYTTAESIERFLAELKNIVSSLRS